MRIEVAVPDGKSGDWKVEGFSISEEAASAHNMRAMFQPGNRTVEPGSYKKLTRNGDVIMSNTPAEIRDHVGFITIAKELGGHVLINGLGLGVALVEVLTSDAIEKVTVVEASADVIALTGATYAKDDRVHIVKADAFEYKAPVGSRFSAVWHDIWDTICADNLEEMKRLHRKYGTRSKWQGSWCREECEFMERQWRREFGAWCA